MKIRKIIVDTDVIADHLTTKETISILRAVMRQYFCYTTVFNAAELFAMAKTKKEARAVEEAMYAMKILGVNGKSARNIGPLLNRSRSTLAGLIAGVCIESRLPLLTLDAQRYAGIKHLKIVTVKKALQQ